MAEDDFNRLYERLVARCTNKKKRVDAAAAKKTNDRDVAASQEVLEAARQEEIRREEQLERDAHISGTVKSLRLGRNLRGVARMSRCCPHRLAFRLVAATEPDGDRFVERYRRVKRQRSRLSWRREERTLRLKRCMRLEAATARLYLRRAAAFRADAPTTLEGRHRAVDELLFFSPNNSKFQSRIGYADAGNVVPLPPQPSHQ
ncbi:hypothetical protein PRNP1_009155 [Phytophthora ramorum]